MNSLRDDFMHRLLPMLRCIRCDSSEASLILKARHISESAMVNLSLAEEMLECRHCAKSYPLTGDYIPIMWTDEIRSFLEGGDPGANSVSANMAVYDRISHEYDAYMGRDEGSEKRIKNTVERVLKGMWGGHDPAKGTALARYRRPLHLDYGCGHGHVLRWLQEFGFVQVGLDVSLVNLRNAREHTGTLVVCGDATKMPFCENLFDIVTESAALHHIEHWKCALSESIRVVKNPGGIVIDAEPTADQMDWSRLARAAYELRYPIYRLMSYMNPGKVVFRDTKLAKTNSRVAEIYNQPGKGFAVDEVRRVFSEAGFSVEMVLSPTPELTSEAQPGWKAVVINMLSGKNPWNPQNGGFTAYAYRSGNAGRFDSDRRSEPIITEIARWSSPTC